MEIFLTRKVQQKLLPRVKYWQKITGLKANWIGLYPFKGRWANCNEDNEIEFHPRCMEFSAVVADYIIVHELCHILHKDHSKIFWSLVEQYYPNWRDCHAIVEKSGRSF